MYPIRITLSNIVFIIIKIAFLLIIIYLQKGGKNTTAVAYRFFNNKNITSDKMLSSHQEDTLESIKAKKLVLIVY